MTKNIVPYNGFGFTIHLINPPYFKYLDGSDVLDVHYGKLEKNVLKMLTKKKSPITGSQLRFIRSTFQMTQNQFSGFLNLANQAMISKYESAENDFSGMDTNTEILLRLKILEKIGSFDKPFKLSKKLVEITPIKRSNNLEDEIITLKAS